MDIALQLALKDWNEVRAADKYDVYTALREDAIANVPGFKEALALLLSAVKVREGE